MFDKLLLNTIIDGGVELPDTMIEDVISVIKEYPEKIDSKTIIDKITIIGGLETLRSDY